MKKEKLKEIFDSLSPIEKCSLRFELFPERLLWCNLTKHEAKNLIRMKHKEDRQKQKRKR